MKKISILFAAIALAACGGAPSEPTAGGARASCTTRAYAEIGGPFALVDETGAAVTEADFKGRPTLVYFGFTYCPDVCPMTLVTVDQALAQLPEDVAPPQTVLISVDPERDTPEAMARYVGNDAFPEGLKGLTGTPEAVRAAADAFRADYNRVDAPESYTEYTMDHTSILYLMDEDWQLKTFFTHEDTPESISQCLVEHLG
ncbi:MAG: SCO family protein [Hyphomonadaceae bacterium]|nr:SCO family protein [Hyphomonadaceae bacterium]